MTAIEPPYHALAYHHAGDLPQNVWDTLSQDEAAANVVLPFAMKARSIGRGSDDDVQLWIVLYDGAKDIVFVLSCTQGPLGNYPIFIATCKPLTQLARENLTDVMPPLVRCLLDEVHPQRIFSVFALAEVAEIFAEVIESQVPAEHSFRALRNPTDLYYDATLTFCTRETLKEPSESVYPFPGTDDVVVALLPANMSHLNAIKNLCREFSETSPPFVLEDIRAELEAKTIIANQQVWIHLVQNTDKEAEVACLVATTRESDNVTAVTKVYTPDKWRRKGCAARLLQRVCQDLLQKKNRVVLYVGNSKELEPARKVYHKIGFQGLNRPPGQQMKGVERWIEIGFTGTSLGHW